ncbi:MAG: class I SAM-dependent methyltransferase [Alphaproteobacteria bacterium]|nr:class I SAM-dependent methyltransferase [Alphaproteobacteria bacterium]
MPESTDAHDKPTLAFYATEAAAYAAHSEKTGATKALATFLTALPKGAAVLDLGCGTGRDTRALIEAGMTVTAVDGAPEMAREAEKRLGIAVRVQLFENLDDMEVFDGIWANASLLHVPRAGLPAVFARVYRALKPGALLYASFKSGGKDGRDKLDRYYNYLDADEVTALLRGAGAWSSIDIKQGRGTGYDGTETGWVQVFARKSHDGAF